MLVTPRAALVRGHGATTAAARRRRKAPRSIQLDSRHRPAQQRHGPAWLEQERHAPGVRVAHDEPPRGQPLDHGGQGSCRVLARPVRRRHAVDHPHAVGIGLEASNAPDSCVTQGAIVRRAASLSADWPDAAGETHRPHRRRQERAVRCVPGCDRTHVSTSSRITPSTKARSKSSRWATLTMAAGVLRSGPGVSYPPTSSVAPVRQLAKVGEASRVLSAAASARRSIFARKLSTGRLRRSRREAW